MKHNEEYHPDETEVKYIHEILAMIAAYGGDRNILDNFFRVKGKMEVRSLSDMMKNTLKKSKDEGIAEGRIKDIERIMQKLNISQDEAMDFLDVSVAEREDILAVLKATQERK